MKVWTCPICDTRNEEHRTACIGCATPLDAAAVRWTETDGGAGPTRPPVRGSARPGPTGRSGGSKSANPPMRLRGTGVPPGLEIEVPAPDDEATRPMVRPPAKKTAGPRSPSKPSKPAAPKRPAAPAPPAGTGGGTGSEVPARSGSGASDEPVMTQLARWIEAWPLDTPATVVAIVIAIAVLLFLILVF